MKHKLLSILLCLAMALSLLPTAALAEEATGAGPIKVGETSYSSFSDAVNAAEPDESGVITYKISGKVDVTDIGWVQVAKAGLPDLSKVEFIGIHGVIFVGGIRVRWSGRVGHTGRDRGLSGGVLLRGVLSVRFVQRLRDQVQHEVSLGELFAGSERLALQMTLDALEEFFGDLECHGSAFFSHLNAAFLIFNHVVVFLDEICDVLTGGLAQPFSFFTDPLM